MKKAVVITVDASINLKFIHFYRFDGDMWHQSTPNTCTIIQFLGKQYDKHGPLNQNKHKEKI